MLKDLGKKLIKYGFKLLELLFSIITSNLGLLIKKCSVSYCVTLPKIR